jgi:hypothetical protein
MKLRSLVFAWLLALSANIFAQDTNFWIFLCFGQSNMEGFPGIEEQDKSGVGERFKVFATVDFPKQERIEDAFRAGLQERGGQVTQLR